MTGATVFYNGQCPVCAAGIRGHRRLASPSTAARWHDMTATPDALAAHGATLDDVRRRLHAVTASGDLLVGLPACAALWDDVPRLRWLARLVRSRMVRPVATALYEAAAAGLHAWNRRRFARDSSPV